jgi:hypothetical protein
MVVMVVVVVVVVVMVVVVVVVAVAVVAAVVVVCGGAGEGSRAQRVTQEDAAGVASFLARRDYRRSTCSRQRHPFKKARTHQVKICVSVQIGGRLPVELLPPVSPLGHRSWLTP